MRGLELKTKQGYVLVKDGINYPEIIERRAPKGKTYQLASGRFVYLGKDEYLHYEDNGQLHDIDLLNPDHIKAPYLLTRTAGIGYIWRARGAEDAEISVKMLGIPGKIIAENRDGGIVYYPDVDTDLDVYTKPGLDRYGIYKVIKSKNSPRRFQYEISWDKEPKNVQTASGPLVIRDLGSELGKGIADLLSLEFDKGRIPPCRAWDTFNRPVEVKRSIAKGVLTEEVFIPEGFDAFPVTLDVETELITTDGTWVCPERVTELTVECWGGGGGGSSYTQGTWDGGGGGAYARALIAVSSGTSYSYTVAKKASGALEYVGRDGYDTYWESGSQVKAAGGKGGNRDLYPSGAPGGSTQDCHGDVKYAGGRGGIGDAQGNKPGAGGGGAGSTGPGGNASGLTAGLGTMEYGGDGGAGGSAGPGKPGQNYGGGGSGSEPAWVPAGDGAPGLLLLTYIVKPPPPGAFHSGSAGSPLIF